MKKLSPLRRALLLTGAGVLVAAVVLTVHDVVPRRTQVIVMLEGRAAERGMTRTLITREGETVVDAEARASAAQNHRHRYRFWLTPGEHQLEVTSQGCPAVHRNFDPSVVDTVNVLFACGEGASIRRQPSDRDNPDE